MQNLNVNRSNSETGEETPIAFDTRTTLFYLKGPETIYSDVGEGWFSSPDPFPWELSHGLFAGPGLTCPAGHAIGEELVDQWVSLEDPM